VCEMVCVCVCRVCVCVVCGAYGFVRVRVYL